MTDVPHFDHTDDLRGGSFTEADLTEASFREADLTRVRMRGVILEDADIDGYIVGLRINGVDVAPLVEAELDRRHPERTALKATDPAGLRHAWEVVEDFWAPTMNQARQLDESVVHRSVDDEWSFAETLRHLVFVTDAWLSRSVLGERQPFHRLGLPASFIKDGAEFGIDPVAEPTFDDVIAARASRMTTVREYLRSITDDDLRSECGPNTAPGFPPPQTRRVVQCLQVILDEEWAHHQFAVRDLAKAALAGGDAGAKP